MAPTLNRKKLKHDTYSSLFLKQLLSGTQQHPSKNVIYQFQSLHNFMQLQNKLFNLYISTNSFKGDDSYHLKDFGLLR